MTYQVRTQAFEGPFDLLLHLITKRELDIYEVSLAAITGDYLQHLKAMQELDLEIATEFLVVAATLIEIKAARLLPGREVDEEEALAISERDLLIARLLEYRAFKQAAAAVAEGMASNAGFLARTAGPGREFDHLCPDLLARVSAVDLAALASRALAPKTPPRLDLSHITPIRITVAEAVEALRRALAAKPIVSFRDLTGDTQTRIDLVVRFLAVLELVKRDEVEVEQAGTFGDIVLRRIEGARRAGGHIDEYDGAPERVEVEE